MKTLAIDFDGVVHRYSRGWQDGTIYDGAVVGTGDALERLSRRYRLVLHSARAADQREEIEVWLAQRRLDVFEDVTHEKPAAHGYLDDRAIRFHNWPEAELDIQRYVG